MTPSIDYSERLGVIVLCAPILTVRYREINCNSECDGWRIYLNMSKLST